MQCGAERARRPSRTARRQRCCDPLALLLGACDGRCAAAPPQLAFTETAYDFGRVAQGTPVEHRFAFINDGGTDLTIINLRAACDCEATLHGGRDIAPGAGGAVQGRFDTDAVYGPQRWTITVYSNDPTQRAVVLSVSGEVVLDVAADPPQVYLGVVPPGVAALREVGAARRQRCGQLRRAAVRRAAAGAAARRSAATAATRRGAHRRHGAGRAAGSVLDHRAPADLQPAASDRCASPSPASSTRPRRRRGRSAVGTPKTRVP